MTNTNETVADTIQKLKEVDLFDVFKNAMETIIKETNKPQLEWNDGDLNCDGLGYFKDSYLDFYNSWIDGDYNDNMDVDYNNNMEVDYNNNMEDYLYDLESVSLKPASDNTMSFKSFYCDSYHDDYQMSGLDFGCITWNPYMSLRGAYDFHGYNENDSTAYYEYINKVTDIDFSCFHGMTPQQILDILNEVK